jgi:hypothetical protein
VQTTVLVKCVDMVESVLTKWHRKGVGGMQAEVPMGSEFRNIVDRQANFLKKGCDI